MGDMACPLALRGHMLNTVGLIALAFGAGSSSPFATPLGEDAPSGDVCLGERKEDACTVVAPTVTCDSCSLSREAAETRRRVADPRWTAYSRVARGRAVGGNGGGGRVGVGDWCLGLRLLVSGCLGLRGCQSFASACACVRACVWV